jgi:carbamoyltransferase
MADLILAVRSGHNASACIGDRSNVLFGIQEERLNREKNYWGFPRLSIHACLEAVGATPKDLAAVACPERIILSRYHGRDDILKAFRRHGTLMGRLRQRIAVPLATALLPNYGEPEFRRLLAAEGLADVPLSIFDHHTAHAATAYYGLRTDPEKKYLVLTCDGAGDGLCATVRVMGGGKDEIVSTTPMADTLGAIYAWVTFAMGFLPMEHEYKLMGMAPYASESATQEAASMFHAYLGLDASGLRYQRKISEKISNFGERLFADMKGKRFDYLCAGLQRFTENILTEWTAATVKKTGVRDVLAAGGVFMNVKANQKISELEEVASFEAFPSCGDETLPLGGYYLEAAQRFGQGEVRPLKDFYLGDDILEDAARDAASRSGLHFHRPDDMAGEVADLLIAGKPVARCAGRMEFGARALGNRSILADPSNQDVVRVINQMVKKRDFWMPFAPMVLEDRQHDYLCNPKHLRSPYMMMTFDTKENFRELIAAVHNADLTCRAQILRESQNSELFKIVKAFESRTGRGVLLNTSFNLHGWPIVRTPEDAIEVLRDSGLEHLQVGNYLISKPR